MLEQVLDYIHNYFEKDVVQGTYKIVNGTLTVDFLKSGQYFKIVGSVFNDGIYTYPAYELVDEEFTGWIWAMAVPPAVIALSNEIDEWVTANAKVLESPYTSESFDGYTYTKANGKNGYSGYTWTDQFGSRLNKWRKIS